MAILTKKNVFDYYLILKDRLHGRDASSGVRHFVLFGFIFKLLLDTNFGCHPFISKTTVINVQRVFKALYTTSGTPADK